MEKQKDIQTITHNGEPKNIPMETFLSILKMMMMMMIMMAEAGVGWTLI